MPPRHDLSGLGVKMLPMALFFTILLVLCTLLITWAVIYIIYRTVTDES